MTSLFNGLEAQIEILKSHLQEPLKIRLGKEPEPRTLDRNRPGHIIKMIVGIIQDYGALTYDEIALILSYFDIEHCLEQETKKGSAMGACNY